MANDEFREDHESRRRAGKAKQHEKRLENATYTAAEVKVLTEAALRLGRKEASERIYQMHRPLPGNMWCPECNDELWPCPTAETCQRLSSLPSGAVSDERSGGGGCDSVHPMASHIPCTKPAGHEGDHVSKNGRNWRPKEVS